MSHATWIRDGDVERDAECLRSLARRAVPRAPREVVARRLRRMSRAYVDRHADASAFVNDAGERSGLFWRAGDISYAESVDDRVTRRNAVLVAEAMLEIQPSVDAYNSAISIAILDGELDRAVGFARRGVADLGTEGMAAQLAQWLGVALHLLGEHQESLRALTTAAGSDVGIVRRCSLATACFVADRVADSDALGWAVDRLAEEESDEVRRAVRIIAETRSAREGQETVDSALSRHLEFASPCPHRRRFAAAVLG